MRAMDYRTGPDEGPETAGGRARRAVFRYVARAPGTYLWLLLLLGTSLALHHMPPHEQTDFLRTHSTNVHELTRHPARVLAVSALWLDGGPWILYAVLYSLLHAPAEHRLGTGRWFVVVALSHVLATLVSQALLLRAVHYGYAPGSSLDTVDVGVSYALAGVVGVLTHLIVAPWRYAYLVAVLLVYVPPLWNEPTFTDLGHFTALLIGLLCAPLTRGRGPLWDPAALVRRVRGR